MSLFISVSMCAVLTLSIVGSEGIIHEVVGADAGTASKLQDGRDGAIAVQLLS